MTSWLYVIGWLKKWVTVTYCGKLSPLQSLCFEGLDIKLCYACTYEPEKISLRGKMLWLKVSPGILSSHWRSGGTTVSTWRGTYHHSFLHRTRTQLRLLQGIKFPFPPIHSVKWEWDCTHCNLMTVLLNRPHFMVAFFDEPDESGHVGGPHSDLEWNWSPHTSTCT